MSGAARRVIDGRFELLERLGGGPGMSVYLSDAYRSGYLKADTGGKVIATNPREK
ncbi:hypothetical protein ACFU99_19575 [Streptomyces sp. NPDC057654]|uniref:hypothetical protein n=1 Tax=Streptomyces sp. NPDC057654 TaxID=3346196 RepID=UPI0036957F76